MTGKNIAEQWSKLFVLEAFDDGQRLVFTPESYGAEGRSILSGVMRDLNMAQDFLYNEVYNALEAIAESGLEDVENNPGAYYVTDSYTSNLTAWLASNINHAQYLTEALDKYGVFRDGSDALRIAQDLAMEKVWMAVIRAVQDELDTLDYEEE